MTLVRNTGRCATAAAIAMLLAGAAVQLLDVEPAMRGLLDLQFDPAPPSVSGALSIAINNARIAGATLLCAVIHPRLGGRSKRGCDLALASTLVLNASAVGLALGAYREQAVLALLPHLPLEGAALTLCGGVFLTARSQPLQGTAILCAAVIAALLLVCAAGLETYLNLGTSS